MKGAGELIKEAVLAWPGVEAVPHRFGGIEYRLGRKEMGHVHGDRLADLPYRGSSMTRSSRRVAPSSTTSCLNRGGSVAGWTVRTTPPAWSSFFGSSTRGTSPSRPQLGGKQTPAEDV